MELENIGDGYRQVLEIVMRTIRQTQMVLPENQPSRVATIPAVRQTQVQKPIQISILTSVKITKSNTHASITRMSIRGE